MDEPIEVGILPKGTRVDAWVGDPKAPGNWVGNPGISRDAAAVDALDHLKRPRVRAHYEITDDVAVLRSSAKPQSGEAGSWIKGTGGGTQFTSPDLSRHLRLVR